jgi:hypothetical protein
MKAFIFEPHGNFGPFLASSVASLDELCAKNEQSLILKSSVVPQVSFSSFCKKRFDDSKPF